MEQHPQQQWQHYQPQCTGTALQTQQQHEHERSTQQHQNQNQQQFEQVQHQHQYQHQQHQLFEQVPQRHNQQQYEHVQHQHQKQYEQLHQQHQQHQHHQQQYEQGQHHHQEEQRTVLIPADDIERADAALAWFAANLNLPTDRVLVAHVLDGRTEAPPQLAEHVSRQCRSLGLSDRVSYIERSGGGVGPTIVDLADEADVAFVLMASRGFGSIARTLLGSVSDYVAHHMHRPVIVVPPEAAAGPVAVTRSQEVLTSLV